MRVLFWVQHLLGTGHLRRALSLTRAMAAQGLQVTLASGGPPTAWPAPPGVRLVQLAAVRAADLRFSQLVDARGRPVDAAFMTRRREQLLALFAETAPQVVLTEMFPFGRRAFRFELMPLLKAAGRQRPRPWVLCSVRDILVEKRAPRSYAWMRDVARLFYHRVLVHTDPSLVPFGLTFPHADALADRLIETGYVVDVGDTPTPSRAGNGEVLVSTGGGRVGAKLLRTAIGARELSVARQVPWRLIAGANLDQETYEGLTRVLSQGVALDRERADFHALLGKSLLSVSQAGYNTVGEALYFGRPMVLVPFETATETEQRLRAERLAARGLAEMVRETDLSPSTLARAIDVVWQRKASARPRIDLSGTETTARLVAELATRPAGEPSEPSATMA